MRIFLTRLGMAIATLALLCSFSFAADYTSMSNEELAVLRGHMQNVSPEEHAAFQAEWRSRVQNMSAEDQQQLLGHPANTTNFQSGPQYQEHAGSGPNAARGKGNGENGYGVDGGLGLGGPGSGMGGGNGGGRGGGRQ